jgi:excisionase family DNA binding protein
MTAAIRAAPPHVTESPPQRERHERTERGGMAEEWLTVEQAAVIAKKDKSTIRFAIRNKRLKAKQFGKSYAIHRDDLQKWIDNEKLHRPGKKPE